MKLCRNSKKLVPSIEGSLCSGLLFLYRSNIMRSKLIFMNKLKSIAEVIVLLRIRHFGSL
jgi:hypothetical protein